MAGEIIEIIIILVLIILTGYLSMAELAVVSIRKAKMQKYLEDGDERAQIVFDLLEDPNEFLSTVQIGISLIGVLTGAFGGVTLAEPLSKLISFVPYNQPISVAIVVIITTYLTLVVGEIVPKVIALNEPEKVSLRVARKNGKSLFAAAVMEYLAFLDDEYGGEVYCLAPKAEETIEALEEFKKARNRLEAAIGQKLIVYFKDYYI